ATVSADDAGWAHRVDTALRALEEAIESGNEGRDGDQASWPGGISDIGITPAVYDPRGITDRPASWGDDGDR
ncbi:MAG: hypothetical protein ACPGVG_17180, partial [Mycobacterium sp.]